MALNKFKIIQHNVLNWQRKKNELYNTYLREDPDIVGYLLMVIALETTKL